MKNIFNLSCFEVLICLTYLAGNKRALNSSKHFWVMYTYMSHLTDLTERILNYVTLTSRRGDFIAPRREARNLTSRSYVLCWLDWKENDSDGDEGNHSEFEVTSTFSLRLFFSSENKQTHSSLISAQLSESHTIEVTTCVNKISSSSLL